METGNVCVFEPNLVGPANHFTWQMAGRYQEAEEKFLQAWELQKKASKAMAEW